MKTPRQQILEEIEVIARSHRVAMRDLMGQVKVRKVVRARRAAMWFVWFKYGKNFTETAKVFGRKEHTTTFHAIGAHLLSCGLTDHPLAIAAKRKQEKIRNYHRSRQKPKWALSEQARLDRNRRARENYILKADRVAA